MARTHESQTSFARAHHLVRHIKSQLKLDTTMAKLKCQHCGDDFRSDLLQNHIATQHPLINTSSADIFSFDLHSMPIHTPSKRPSIHPSTQAAKFTFTFPRRPIKNIPTWAMTCNPNPSGLPPFDPDTTSTESMDEWMQSFWPGYISSTLSTELKEALKKSASAHHPPPSKDAEKDEMDALDLRLRLINTKSKRPKSPTSSSSSYGSPNSAHSRASSWSGSAGGHIPGTSRDVMEFPFGYPTASQLC